MEGSMGRQRHGVSSMRKVLIASTVAMLGIAAHAADLQRPLPNQMPVKAPVYVAPAFNWTGFYVGVNGGGGFGSSWSDLTGHFGTSGGVAGGTVGYNAQFGRWVLGGEGDMDWSNVGGNTSNGCPVGCSVQNNWLGTVRGRAGYSFDRFLPYVTGGLAVGDVNASAPGFAGQDPTQLGWTAGAGVEYAVAPNWSAKVEYLRVDLGRFNCGLNCGPAPTDNVSFHENLVRGGINFRF
jgi:outer membrane immunogenic protein